MLFIEILSLSATTAAPEMLIGSDVPLLIEANEIMTRQCVHVLIGQVQRSTE